MSNSEKIQHLNKLHIPVVIYDDSFTFTDHLSISKQYQVKR